MLYTIPAWIFSKNKNYLSILKKSELGVYYFCRKVAIECEENGYNSAALHLRKQAETEYTHAQAFSRLMGGKLTESCKDLERRGDTTLGWSKVDWDTSEQYVATNLSQSAIAKFFFDNKSADSYSLFNKLAFMQVLETHQARFYEALSQFVPIPVVVLLAAIVREEREHSRHLSKDLTDMLPSKWSAKYLDKWRGKAWLTILRLPFYLVKNV